ncbi:hypothetical protein C8Q78DRAFT_410023 [Trametes maxima]|nr:hypothetical protein C8Q78DRAFT_410023 [Trametes maxima]
MGGRCGEKCYERSQTENESYMRRSRGEGLRVLASFKSANRVQASVQLAGELDRMRTVDYRYRGYPQYLHHSTAGRDSEDVLSNSRPTPRSPPLPRLWFFRMQPPRAVCTRPLLRYPREPLPSSMERRSPAGPGINALRTQISIYPWRNPDARCTAGTPGSAAIVQRLNTQDYQYDWRRCPAIPDPRPVHPRHIARVSSETSTHRRKDAQNAGLH